ncbi:hypothetical protein [Streptomyces sp. SGAir0957]
MATSVILARHHHGNDVDIPWPYWTGYIAIGLMVWLVAAALVARHMRAETEKDLTSEDLITATAMGFCAAIMWPLTLVGAAVWKVLTRLVLPRVNLTKGPQR